MILGAPTDPGPFKARDLPFGSEYELDNGHPVQCMPTGKRGGRAQSLGARVIGTDPLVLDSGVEVGFQLGEGTLRAPDVSVLAESQGDGWATTAPPLAIEYADHGQDEEALQRKIEQLLAAGTRAVWVVRLHRIRQVEVYTLDEHGALRKTVAQANEELTLPGVLGRPVPVAALFDPRAADLATFQNLLARFGFVHPDDAREEGREEGREAGLAEGLDRGREEGRVEALRATARLVLGHRGVADADAAIAGLDADALLRLIVGAPG